MSLERTFPGKVEGRLNWWQQRLSGVVNHRPENISADKSAYAE
jgi:hypothetical protein